MESLSVIVAACAIGAGVMLFAGGLEQRFHALGVVQGCVVAPATLCD